MEGLVRLFDHAVRSSVRGYLRWTEILIPNLRGFDRSLVPALQHVPVESAESYEEDCEDSNKWEGFLWAAPKKRTSAMKRLRRKFGHQDWGSPQLKPKTNLRICDTCGHHYEAKHLCRNCYERVKAETNIIRQNVEAKFGDSPVDKSVVILYESEKETVGKMEINLKNKYEDNILVEIPKPRPVWFSSNLLQKSTVTINLEEKAVTAQNPNPVISSDSSKPSKSN